MNERKESNEEFSVEYLDGLKNYHGEVVDAEFILNLGDRVSFGEFLEQVRHFDSYFSLSLHVTDPNWYQEGNYRTGALDVEFHSKLHQYLRGKEIIGKDQTLDSVCHYSPDPNRGPTRNGERPELMVGISGEDEDARDVVFIYLNDDSALFKFQEDKGFISGLRMIAAGVGRQEVSIDEYYDSKYRKKS